METGVFSRSPRSSHAHRRRKSCHAGEGMRVFCLVGQEGWREYPFLMVSVVIHRLIGVLMFNTRF